MSINYDDVRTDTLFRDIALDYEAQAAEKNIDLRFNTPPKLPVISGERDKISMALHNIIGNALKYTPSGGSVTAKRPHISCGPGSRSRAARPSRRTRG